MVRQGAQEEVVKRRRRRVLVEEARRRWSWKVGGLVIGERSWLEEWEGALFRDGNWEYRGWEVDETDGLFV